MEKVNFDYSMKNIPLHSIKEYKLQLLDSCGKFITIPMTIPMGEECVNM